VYEGTMDDMSPEQEACLQEFKQWIAAKRLDPTGKYDDYDLLRFCRARKFVLADV
jgi:hypothetical protein